VYRTSVLEKKQGKNPLKDAFSTSNALSKCSKNKLIKKNNAQLQTPLYMLCGIKVFKKQKTDFKRLDK